MEHTNLRESLEDFRQRTLSALDWYDTEVSGLRASLDKCERELINSTARNVVLESLVRLHEAEIERLKNPVVINPPPPPPPPIEIAPDIEISLEGLGSFRPPLRGDRQGKEIRYRGSLNNEIDILIDINENDSATNPQIAICIERCHADLPTTATTLNTRLGIEIGSETAYDKNFRLPPHARPRYISNPNKPPKFNAQSLIDAGLLPNFDLSAKPSLSDLDKVLLGKHPWTRWLAKYPNSDPISENYSHITDSWTGGAGNEEMNEAQHITPAQHMYLTTQDERLWPEVVALANSSGNYAIHYRFREGKYRYPLPDETGALPFLQGDIPVTLKTAAGIKLPIPEPAHEHSLTYLAYLLTRERWYLEELKSWAGYNLLTRPKNQLRLDGIIWSGQIRAAAWSIRALLHVTLACKLANDPDYETYRATLIANLNWMRDTFTIEGRPNYRATGVCNLEPFRAAPLLSFVTLLPRPRWFATWNHHILASVLNECVRAGFPEAIPMRDHLTRVVQGQWQHGLSPFHIGWGNHAFNLDSWTDIVRTTFEGATSTNPPRNTFPTITTPDYVAWARSAIVAAVDGKQSWAIPALKWIDENAPSYKGGIPAPWKINPAGSKP